jgi:hypothetical protein
MVGPTYEDVRRARVACLTGIVIISVGAGFLGGRISAWLIPPGGSPSLSTSLGQVAPEPPARQAAQSTQERKDDKSAEAAPRADDAPQTGPAESAKVDAGPRISGQEPPNAAQRVESAEQSADRSEERRVYGATVVNAGSTRAGRAWQEDSATSKSIQERSDASGSITECARRYASFRESDGTYQPYGSSQRRRCPLLR